MPEAIEATFPRHRAGLRGAPDKASLWIISYSDGEEGRYGAAPELRFTAPSWAFPAGGGDLAERLGTVCFLPLRLIKNRGQFASPDAVVKRHWLPSAAPRTNIENDPRHPGKRPASAPLRHVIE